MIVWRWIYGGMPSPYYADLVKFEGECDRLQHYEMCYPGNWAEQVGLYACRNRCGPGKVPVEQTYVNISYNFMTPIDENRTRYFWFQHRNTDPDDREISERMNAGALAAFQEDRDIPRSGA